MSDDTSVRISELERRVAELSELHELNAQADDRIEVAIRERLSLVECLASVFPLLTERLGARAAFVRTYDESLTMSNHAWPDATAVDSIAESVAKKLPHRSTVDGDFVLAQRIDVAGQDFGVAGVIFAEPPAEERIGHLAELLDVWCEELDNYLAAIAQARRKHRVTLAISDALKRPVLEEGINEAIRLLREEVPFDELVLAYQPDRNMDIVRPVCLRFRAAGGYDEQDPYLLEHARHILEGDLADVAEHLGMKRFREEVLISGVKQQEVVGRLMVSSEKRSFSTFDRDLLERFADYLRQRIVDFSREWRQLSLCFPRELVRRMLREEGYRERLDPSEHDVAILYCDISGFTRVSEQVLQKPPLIGKLIDTWSDRVVDIIWRTGGVFDKMVGDCVIGLWGPPFFEMSPEAACTAAARAALEIRAYTQALKDEGTVPGLEALDGPLGVSTGLNYCPLFVGRFGPNEDFTGFSSGMNNTARLQGVADRDEVLCMDGFVTACGEAVRFGVEREAAVKNVAEPLRFRELFEVKG